MNNGDDTVPATTKVAQYTSSALTHTVDPSAEGLTVGKIYQFRLRATNAVGNSEYSDPLRVALVDAPGVPGTPAVTLAQTSQTKIAFEWGESATLPA